MKEIGKVCKWLFVLLLFSGCEQERYEWHSPIDDNGWEVNDLREFKFEKSGEERVVYKLFLTTRLQDSFAFQNLQIQCGIRFPDGRDSLFTKSVPLQQSSGGASRDWLGDCLGKVCNLQVAIIRALHLKEPGSYTFFVQPNHRENPIYGLESVGLRLEAWQ